MSRRTNYTVGLLLILATMAIFSGIGLYTFPQVFGESEAASVNQTDENKRVDDATVAGTQSEPSATPLVLPTSGLEEVALSTPLPTEAPPSPTAEPLNTSENIEDEQVQSAESTERDDAPQVPVDPQTDDDNRPIIALAKDETWLFAIQDEAEGWLGIFFSDGDAVTILGRSEDARWLHVEHGLAVQGWVYTDRIDAGAIDIAALPVSQYVGSLADAVSVAQPSPTAAVVQQVAAAVIQATATPRASQQTQPTWTPWPTPTPVPTGPWATATPTPVATWQPQATNTPLPTWTAQPTRTPRAAATATVPPPTNTPAPLPTAPAPANDPVPTQDGELITSNAIAWWHTEAGSIKANGGSWSADIVVRVPTSFQYNFEIDRLARTVLRDANLDGDDYFVLTVSGMGCGSRFSAEMIARQNGARMKVQNEFNLQEGAIVIQPPC